VPGDVGHQVFARNAHQIVAYIVHIVFYGVRAVFQAHVLVDGREPHGHGAGPVHSSFVNEGNLQAMLLRPVGRLYRRSAGGHAAPQNKQVSFHSYCFKIRHW